MSRLAVAVEIAASADQVWAVIEPIERHVDWMADAEAIRFTSDRQRGEGTTFVCTTAVGPLRLDDRMRITAWEAGRTMGVRHEGLVTGEGQFAIDEVAPGRTSFRWAEQLTFPWFLGGPIGGAIASRLVLRRIWLGNLRRLRALVETAVVAANRH